MSQIQITTLHAGLNLKDDPVSMGEGSTDICTGVDLTVEGVLRTAQGLGTDTLTAAMESAIPGTMNITYAKIVYMNDTRYCLLTTSAGIYSNGSLINTSIVGAFDALVVGSNIYISDGTTSLRFDGTTAYQWGITAPTLIPTLTASGTGTLSGDYYFMYSWGRCDAFGNVLEWSGPALDTDGEPWIIGPTTFSSQGLAWGERTASSDSQVNCCIIYISGGTLDGWWQYYVIPDNGTSSGSVALGESDLYQRMISVSTLPAPAIKSMVLWNDRIWAVDGSDSVKCSDISPYGDIMYGSWPSTNSFEFVKGGSLLSIHEVNRQLVVRGEDGEWSFDISDPLDLTTIKANRNSTDSCIGIRAVLQMPGSLIYPAIGSFVESNGSIAKAVLPEASTVISASGMENAVGIFRSFDGFFAFTDPSSNYVIAKLDLITGKPRISYHNVVNFEIKAMTKDGRTGKLYAVSNGYFKTFEDGYLDDYEALTLQLRTKGYSLGPRVAWMSLKFEHNTGGQFFLVKAIVDKTEVASSYFTSSIRTQDVFWFGPVVGQSIQIEFSGRYSDLAEIYLPMTIYANG